MTACSWGGGAVGWGLLQKCWAIGPLLAIGWVVNLGWVVVPVQAGTELYSYTHIARNCKTCSPLFNVFFHTAAVSPSLQTWNWVLIVVDPTPYTMHDTTYAGEFVSGSYPTWHKYRIHSCVYASSAYHV